MSTYKGRDSLSQVEDYVVETVPDADIIVNANETNEYCGDEMEQKILQTISKYPINRYPAMHGENLCRLIAKNLNLDPFQITLGNGSSELLEKLCYAFGGKGRKISYPSPSFSMYETYAVLADSTPAPFPLTKECQVDPDALIEFCKKEQPNVVIICNPNNPTGSFNTHEAMEKVIKNVDCLVVMDEAYIEFSNDGKDASKNSTLDLVSKYDNLLVLRTFSKAYGLAGLRIGYGAGSMPVMKIMQKAMLPYHVNGFTLAIGELLYKEKDYLNQRVAHLVAQRTVLKKGLEDLGFYVYPSGSNFLCLKPVGDVLTNLYKQSGEKADTEDAKAMAAGSYLFNTLLSRKILVRNYSHNPKLPGCLRISVGLPEENAKILETIGDILKEGKD
ncbi:MAG: histidinol-phosphate transaminase [Acidaminococcus sp.]|jgi:histidinol-phosphate aminotransferase|nr:histidinol-phosphate transaminase [Acidaminococcus sp.]MCI2116427.1 histidinol-phosphate transaminase [Acidaminococcus sp.]